MKRIMILLIIVLIVISLVSCGAANLNTNYTASTTISVSSDTTSPAEGVSVMPLRFQSIEEFIKSVKTPSENDIFKFKDITCYYKPKNLPKEAALQYVEVYETYIMLVYTIDTDVKSDDLTKNIKYCWFRYFGGYGQTYINDEIKKRNGKIIDLESAAKDTTYVSDRSFSEGKENKNLPNSEAWFLRWVQDDECFSGCIPYSIPEEDVAKYLEMEKVTVQ